MSSFTFSKDEKLCSRKIIGEMFISGKSFLCYPLKVIWINSLEIQSVYPVQVSFSVPKKNFKRAHDRNLFKRWMREAYRCQKSALYQSLELKGQKIGLMIVYIGKDQSGFRQIELAITKVISRLDREMNLFAE